MFGIIRLIIGFVFLGSSIILIKKKKAHKHILYIVSISISVVLITILAFLPFENLYITFDSPETAYEYVNYGESNIKLVIEGNSSDFIIDCKNEKEVYLIIPKTSNGWKIGIGSNTKKIVETISDGVIVCVYQYKDEPDYFITIFDTGGEISEIKDNCNSKFYFLEKKNDSLNKTFVTYYTHISELDTQYFIMVNGHKIIPKKQ